MTVFDLPTTLDSANYDVDVELDGVEFRLAIKFNSREEAWYLTFTDTNDVVLRAGLKVVSQWDLTSLWQDLNRPEGNVITALIGSELIAVPNIEQLGEEVILTYLGDS